jgi:hypothetical protein
MLESIRGSGHLIPLHSSFTQTRTSGTNSNKKTKTSTKKLLNGKKTKKNIIQKEKT